MAAFSITSEEQSSKSTLKNLFGFLTDFSNFKSILPEDKVENFEFNQDSCSFNIRGITPLKVKILEKIPFSIIKYELDGFSKFTFVLEAKLNGEADANGNCSVEIHGDINPFIKTLAEKPLQQLVNTMAKKMAQLEV